MQAPELLLKLKNGSILTIIDVRSSSEFNTGHVPRSLNLPILTDHERHLVGVEYKLRGQGAAIELGHNLVEPQREQRVQLWSNLIDQKKQVALICWRGGLRSKIAQNWIQTNRRDVFRVDGGYKAIRHEFLKVYENLPHLIAIGGWTGSGKTNLLKKITHPHIDLEDLAAHRGSSFGQEVLPTGELRVQPAQATFENHVAFELGSSPPKGSFLIEDESTRIGSLNIPKPLKEKMKQSPVIFLDTPIGERAQNIFFEYVEKPLSLGVTPYSLECHFHERLRYLKNHLGGLLLEEIQKQIRRAFSVHRSDFSLEAHLIWITSLLEHHYDKKYIYSFERLNRKVIFRGNSIECRNFIESDLNEPSIQNDRTQSSHF